MRRYILLLFSLIVFTITSNAQEKINVKGKITDSASKEPVPYVHIINKSNNKGAFSDLNGQFLIVVNQGDTLIFSAVGYSQYSLIIKKDLEGLYLEIKLDEKAMELKPVRVFAYRDLESLKKAIVDLDVSSVNKKIPLGLPPPQYTPEDGGMVIRGPITAIVNELGLNKEFNELRKLKKIQEEDNRRKIATAKYNPEVVHKWTGLEGQELASFMEFCKLEETFIINATEYDLVVAVHQCLDEYKNED